MKLKFSGNGLKGRPISRQVVQHIMNIKVFWHICALNHYESVMRDQLAKLLFSGLLQKSTVYAFVYGPDSIKASSILKEYGSNITIVTCNPETLGGERETLRRIHDFINGDEAILYFHTKGVTRVPISREIEDWRAYMEYWLIARHEACIDTLKKGYDAVGLDYYEKSHPHFSGNFWWCSAEHYMRLPKLDLSNLEDASRYQMSETYMLGGHFDMHPKPKIGILHHSWKNLSCQRILPSEYMEAKI